MAQTINYVSFQRLSEYDALIKKYVSDADAKSLKSVAIAGNTLKFYKVESPAADTVPAFSIELPEADLSDLLHKISGATAGDVVIAKEDGTVEDGGVKLVDLAKSADVTKDIAAAKAELESAIKPNTDAIAKLNSEDTVEGSVAKQVKDAKDDLQNKITENKNAIAATDGKVGALDDLKTTAKTDLVSAVNEVQKAIANAQTAGEVTVDTTLTTEGMAKSYTIKQNNKTVATIDIPKDMVVKSGTVEQNPAGQAKGTYLVLTLANATEDKVYVNVGTLVDIYTAKASATQIQVAIDASTREISATIVAGSVTATELANNAIVTAKIADGNVTKAKLSKEVQASLDKADSAIQESDLTSLKADVAANKASLAEGGATHTAIKAAKQAADDAQADVDALATRVETLEGISFVEATEAQIKGLFA